MSRAFESRAEYAMHIIDEALAAPPVSLDEALKHAVAHGRMTETEATDCLAAYQRYERSLIEEGQVTDVSDL